MAHVTLHVRWHLSGNDRVSEEKAMQDDTPAVDKQTRGNGSVKPQKKEVVQRGNRAHKCSISQIELSRRDVKGDPGISVIRRQSR